MAMPRVKMMRSPTASTRRPHPSAETNRIRANAEITAPTAVLPTPKECANSGIAGATTPNPMATATATAASTATSRGSPRNGSLTGGRSEPSDEQVRRRDGVDLGGLATTAHKDAGIDPFDRDHLARQGADASQYRHQELVGLDRLGDPAHHDLLLATVGDPVEGLDAVEKAFATTTLAKLVEPGDRVAVRRDGRVVEDLEQPALDRLGHHVLPSTGLGMHVLPLQADHIDQEPLGQPVLAHHAGREAAPLVRQLEVAVSLG